jgi:DNA repair photolyase
MANIQGQPFYLFPILQHRPSGLARLAAEANLADESHLVEFKALKARSILNRSVSRRQLSHAWSINPYRGCEFACRYCYARYTHEFLEPSPITEPDTDEIQPWAIAFERHIYLKQNAAWLLEQELRAVGPSEGIALGTATDPYQPIERKALITRSLLEVFARKSGYRLGIVSKSTLIKRDIDLLTQIAARNTLVLHITVTTSDANLARLLEPRAPRPDLRLQTVSRLRAAGLIAGVLCSPLLPGITDTVEDIDRMAAHAAKSNASFFAAQPLFLKPCSRPTYLSFVREHFPHLTADHGRRFAKRDFADKPYRERLQEQVRTACRIHGLQQRETDPLLPRETSLNRKPVANIDAATNMREPTQFALFA